VRTAPRALNDGAGALRRQSMSSLRNLAGKESADSLG